MLKNARGGIDKVSNREAAGVVPTGTTGTYAALQFKTPTTAPAGVVSSDSVLSQRNQQDAYNQAANALVTDPGDQFRLSPMQQQYQNMLFQQQGENIGMTQDILKAQELMYDAQLARTNQQYGNLMQDLQSNFQKQSAMAEQQAAALNPYSEAQGAMTSRNFQGAIRGEYDKQSARLQEAATIAQNELAAGNARAYLDITNAMKQSNQMFQKGMMEFMMNAQASWQEGQQWEAEFGLKSQQFGEGRFMDYINTFGADPSFKAAIDQYKTTGQISDALMPIIERGKAIGLTEEQAIAAAGQETLEQAQMRMSQEQFREQMNLRWAEFNQANTERLAKLTDDTVAAEDKQKAAIATASDLYSKLRQLYTDPELKDAVGPNPLARIGGGFSGSDSRIELLASEISAMLTIEAIEGMEKSLTPMSDTDVAILKQFAGGERFTRMDQRQEDYRNNISALMGAVERGLVASGVDVTTALKAGMLTPEEAGAINSSLNGTQTSSPAYYYGQ